eukprot:CAMPEP_0184746874 /NCGR_PEP_ID=MMETSP0315-20130426/9366_1 /TAXON_ID=101924 /ORGANISM="Rhodosorus marinus, Strain UTEX LB 2760" /LENGTH=709 /DNA_ID=CAMNT_0027219623 /DNA_START=62 /DNA_END=2191 /DNA_ORIENTATION=+
MEAKDLRKLCFEREALQNREQSVSEFVSVVRVKAPLSTLRDDLQIHLDEISDEIVGQIQGNFSSFMSLGEAVSDIDQLADEVLEPLEKLREEVEVILLSFESDIEQLLKILEKRSQHASKRNLLELCLRISELVYKCERLLKEVEDSDGQSDERYRILERTAAVSSQLDFCLAKVDKNSRYVVALTPRLEKLKTHVREQLEQWLKEALTADKDLLLRALSALAIAGIISAAEDLFQSEVVKPFVNTKLKMSVCSTMAEERMGNNAESVTTADILESAEILIGDFVRDKCNPVTSLCDSEERLRSFDFVNKAIWPEIESGIESNLNVFSPGIADVFHKSFIGATRIFSLLEGLCSTAEKLEALQKHKQTVKFWRRWSLPVYFQLRFQEVTNTFEDALKSTPSLMTSSTGSEGADTVEITSVRILSPDLYRLQATKALVSALRKCWDDDVFLPPLTHKFLKLSLQLLARYRTWTKKGLEESWGTAMLAKDVAVVFSDVEILTERLPAEVASVVRMGSNGKLPSDATTAIDNAFSDAIENLASLKPDLGERISSVISKGCIETLQTMRGILATYRMTNRPAPTQYSRFVPSVLKPLRQFLTDPDVTITESERNKILKQVVELTVTGYYELATDLLLNVRQTADTLRRLNIGAAGNNAEMDKISMQLYLDVRKFGSDINDLGLDSDQSEAYQKLWNCVKPEAVGVGVGEQGAN